MLSEQEIAQFGLAVANELKARREFLEMSKNRLAQEAGVSVQSVAFIEAGENSPSVSTLFRLCHALEITPEEVLAAARNHLGS